MVGMLTSTCGRAGWTVRTDGAIGRRRKSVSVNAGMFSAGHDQPVTYRHSDHSLDGVARSRRHSGWTGGPTSHAGIWTAPVYVAQSPFRSVVGADVVTPHRSARRNSVRRTAGSVPDDAHSRSAAAASPAVKMIALPSVSPPSSG